MIKIKSLTLKNFLSIGNVAQAVNFDTNELVLVLGENMDLGGNDSRNGCGKTTILNGLSFALFGDPLTKIKISNLINKVNNKNMIVTAIFEKDGKQYKIERGRKPDHFYFGDINGDSDETQGESRITQQEIDKILGFNHLMFKHIIALNTYTVPFLSSSAQDQRQIIEELLGISTLSEKAESLKNLIKDTKQSIAMEEANLKSTNDYNEAIQRTKNNLLAQQGKWELSKVERLNKQAETLSNLMLVDIEYEIQAHEKIKHIETTQQYLETLQNGKKSIILELDNTLKNIVSISQKINSIETNTCFNCNQHYHGDVSLLPQYINELENLTSQEQHLLSDIAIIEEEISTIIIEPTPKTVYKSIDLALEHKRNIKQIEDKILEIDSEENPYNEQINMLSADIKEFDYEALNELTALKEHQEFLLKLLTNKDSFIRKKIINQNINFLNNRLEHYLNKLGLPHNVLFMSDLEVEIQYLGKDLDFDNLSRGERTRLILAMSLSFRDAYEALNDKINLLFVDELIDTGLDSIGVEASLSTLKSINRDTNKSIFLISHRDELLGRIDTTLKVIKENGFTSFEQ